MVSPKEATHALGDPMKYSRAFLIVLLLLAAAPVAMPVQAAAAQPRDKGQEDEAAVLAVVRAALDAIRDADRERLASLELEAYRVVSLQGPIDRRRVFEETAKESAASAAARKPGAWAVRPLSTKVLLDRNGMAVVWTPYVFYLDGVPDHCGVESWTLFRVSGDWKIINFADTDNALAGRAPATVCPK